MEDLVNQTEALGWNGNSVKQKTEDEEEVAG